MIGYEKHRDKPRRSFLLPLAVVVIAGTVVWASAPAVAGAKSSSVLGMETNHLGTFYWAGSAAASTDAESIQQGIAERDPYKVFYRSFRALRSAYQAKDDSKLRSVLQKLDFMIADYEPAEHSGLGVRWRYGNGFGDIPPNWWSGMDGFLGPLTLYAAWQITGDEKYRDVALASARLAIQAPTEGGSMWREETGCWISEFSWPAMTLEKEYYVTNGHLLGLHALYILAKESGDRDLLEAYECTRKGSEYRAQFVRMKDNKWLLYQTNPPTILPTNYFLFEINEYASLALTTGDRFYEGEAQRRRDLYAKHYGLSAVKIDNGYEIVGSAFGPPHAYLPQEYTIRLECSVGREIGTLNHRKQYDASLPLAERLTFTLPLPALPAQCDYSVVMGDFALPIFSQSIFPVVSPEQPTVDASQIKPSIDAAAWDGRVAQIDPKLELKPGDPLNHEARLTLDASWEEDQVLAMILRPEVNSVVSFLLYDQTEEYAYRLYPAAQKDCENIILLTRQGFERFDHLKGPVVQTIMRLDTQPDSPPYKVELSDLAILRNAAEIRSYLQRHPNACYRQKTVID